VPKHSRRSPKAHSYRPYVEQAEYRESPTSLLALPGTVIGAAAAHAIANVAGHGSGGGGTMATGGVVHQPQTHHVLSPPHVVNSPPAKNHTPAPTTHGTSAGGHKGSVPEPVKPVVADPLEPAEQLIPHVHVPQALEALSGGGGGAGNGSGGGGGGGGDGGGGGGGQASAGPDVPAGGAPTRSASLQTPLTASNINHATTAPAAGPTAAPAGQVTPESFHAATKPVATPPIAFEPNEGQWGTQGDARYFSRGRGYDMAVGSSQSVLTLAGTGKSTEQMTLSFAGGNADAAMVPGGQLSYYANYFEGLQSFTDVPQYAQVTTIGVYANVDVRWYGSDSGLEFDMIFNPGASLSSVHMQYGGTASVRTDKSGNLVLTTPSGAQVVEHAPHLYQVGADGARTPVAGAFVLNADHTVGVAAGTYDVNKPLVVDPAISYSTYIGGAGTDTAVAVAVDGNGNTYVVGETPAPVGMPQDTYIAKFSAAADSLVYISYLAAMGGSTQPTGVAVDPSGALIVVGQTFATNFPTTAGAFEETASMSATAHGFVTRLNATGDSLLYSSYLDYSVPKAVAVTPTGEATVAGVAYSGSVTGFVTTAGAYQGTIAGSSGAFVTQLSADGSAEVFSTFLGATAMSTSAEADGIILDSAGASYVVGSVAGSMMGAGFPTTTGTLQTTYGGGTRDAFVAALSADGSTLNSSSFLGGSGDDQGFGIALGPDGSVFCCGQTASSNFPTSAGAYATTLSGSSDAFAVHLNAALTALAYGTFLGGSSTDQANGITVGADGSALIVGTTASTNFPTVNGLSGTGNSGASSQAFLTELNPGGTGLVYSSYLGSTTSGATSAGNAVALDLDGNPYCAGNTGNNFPTSAGVYQSTYGGGFSDAFALKVDPTPNLDPPVITAISPDTGASSSDFITNSQNLYISGTAPPSVTVTLYQDSVAIGTTTSNTSGSWSFDNTANTLGEGVYAFTADTTSGGVVSKRSATQLVTVALSAPTVTLTVPASSVTVAPVVQVQVSDLAGVADGATVSIDVDLDGDTDFSDPGEIGYATGTLENGFVEIAVDPPVGSYSVRANVTNLAGNTGTSSISMLIVTATAAAWTVTDAGVRSVDDCGCNSLQQQGGNQTSIPVQLNSSLGSDPSQPVTAEFNYNSNLASIQPIIQATLQTDTAAAIPSSVTATLTWNGTAQTPQTFTLGSSFSPGDLVTLAVPETAAVSSTGRNTWSLAIAIPGHGTVTTSGVTYTRVETASPFGAGWTLSALNQLVSIPASGSNPAGWLWLYGSGGGSRFFQGTSGTLTGPPEDNGTLVVTGGGLVYTAADGSTINFNSSGYQTSFVQPDGLASISCTWTSGLLTGITWLDGTSSTLNYTSGKISSIVSGSRTWNFTVNTAGDLTQITDPAGRSQNFTYSSHLMTDATQGTLANHWAYNAQNLLTTWRWGNSTSPSTWTVASANSRGLSTAWKGPVTAVVTDPLGNATVYTLTSGSSGPGGKILTERTPDGALQQWTRDSAGRVTAYSNALNQVTTYTRDSLGFVTQETLPDSHTRKYTYQTAFHAMTTFTDENNHVTSYGWDSLGHLLTITDALSGVVTNTYSSSTGLLLTSTDQESHVTTVTWDHRRVSTITTPIGTYSVTYDATSGQVATITDGNSHTTTLTSDAVGNVTALATPDGHTAHWTFNSAGDLATYTDGTGSQETITYDAQGRGLVVTVSDGKLTTAPSSGTRVTLNGKYDIAGALIAVQDGRGFWWTQTLNSVGEVTSQTDPLGNTSKTTYDLAGEVTDQFDPTGAHYHYVYNTRGWTVSETDPLGHTSYNSYDAVGNVTQFTDALTHSTNYTFDAVNELATVTSPMSHTTTLAYWADGLFKSVTDPMAHVTSTSYNFSTKQITTTAAAGTSVAQTDTLTLDANGNVIADTDGLSHTVTYTLNNVDQLTAITDPLSHVTSATVNALGDLKTLADANSHTATVTRDSLDRPVLVTDATSRTEKAVYDANDNVVSTLDGAGDLSQTVFDAAGEPVKLIDGDGNIVQQQFDAAGRVVALIDANNNRTQWQFDKAGNTIKEIEPNNATVTWTYNADNQVTARADQLGRSEQYTYNNDGLLTSEVWKNASGTTVNTLTYGYNADGQLTSAGDNSGTYTFTLDALGRVTSQIDIWGLTLTFTWDAANNLTGVADSLGGTVTNTFDAAGRMTDKSFTDTSSNALSVHYTYDSADQLTGISRYSDATETTLVGSTSYSHDNAGRVTGITHKDSSGATVDSFNYTYNDAGLVAGESSTLGPTTTDTYDRAGQLISDGTNTWSFDKEGNRNSTGYSVTTGNELSSDGTWNYVYDNAGNTIQKTNISTGAVWLYSYDNRNQLVEADHKPSSSGTIDYKEVYTNDVFGNRIAQSAYPTGSGTPTITHFAFDPDGNCWADRTSGGTLITRRLTDDELGAVFARIDGSGVNWLLGDLLNSVRDIASGTGSLIDHIDYGVWGNKTSETHPTYGDRFGWTGAAFDSGTGLYLDHWRSYDPNTGRWLTQDPIGFSAGDANTYRYVGNTPPNARDPSGLDPVVDQLSYPDQLRLQSLLPNAQAPTGEGAAPLTYDENIQLERYVARGTSLSPDERRIRDSLITRAILGGVQRPELVTPPPSQAQLAQQFRDNPTRYSTLDRNPQFDAQQSENSATMRLWLIASSFVPGGQAAMGLSVVLDLAEGNTRDAAVTAATLGITVRMQGVRAALQNGRGAPLTRPASSPIYSNWFDARLQRGVHFPGRPDTAHFREANQQLWQRMQSDQAFARALEAEHPGITDFLRPGPRGAFPDNTPASVGLTWHHSAQREGILELVPTAHHRAPGPVQNSLHPNQQGGMELWGGGRQRRCLPD
jgi:RHS repeat-associated protein